MQKFSLNTVLKDNERLYFCNYLFITVCVQFHCLRTQIPRNLAINSPKNWQFTTFRGAAALPAPPPPPAHMSMNAALLTTIQCNQECPVLLNKLRLQTQLTPSVTKFPFFHLPFDAWFPISQTIWVLFICHITCNTVNHSKLLLH